METSLQTPPPFHSTENLSPEDRQLFNLYGRADIVTPPFSLVHHAFEAVASVHPQAVAVQQHDGVSITYGELDRRANLLANHLRTSHSISTGDRVVLVVSRSIEMVIFIFAVLKAGAQYVPVDGGIAPVETLAHQIADSGASVVLCLPKHKAKAEQSAFSARSRSTGSGSGGHVVSVISLDLSHALWSSDDAAGPVSPAVVDVKPTDGAYVIYTSGTTGKPKGVDVTHRNVTHTLLVEPARLGITVGKKVAQQLNVAFDMCK